MKKILFLSFVTCSIFSMEPNKQNKIEKKLVQNDNVRKDINPLMTTTLVSLLSNPVIICGSIIAGGPAAVTIGLPLLAGITTISIIEEKLSSKK